MSKILSPMEVGMNGGGVIAMWGVLERLKMNIDRETVMKEIEYAIYQRMQKLKNGGTAGMLMYESILADMEG